MRVNDESSLFLIGKNTRSLIQITSDISFPRSPQPTYTITSEFEYLERAWEMTVLPQPKAPGMAVVPPCTHLK